MAQPIRPQTGVCAEASLHGLVLLLHVTSEQPEKVRRRLAEFADYAHKFEERFSESLLSIVLAVGEPYWDVLSPDSRPDGLKTIPEFSKSEHSLPITPFDLAIVIRSDRFDANYAAGLELLNWLGDLVELAEEYTPFRYLDGRDLFGFKYTNEHMGGPHRRELALVSAEQDPEFAGGSFLWLQLSKLALQKFQRLSTAEQEKVMGRERANARLLKTAKATHAEKTQDELWRLHMPYGSLQRPHELSLLFAGQVDLLDQWLRKRLEQGEDGESDPLLDYVLIEHCSAYFVPALNWWRQLGH